MTLPDPSDKNAIGGAHPGTKNISELENDQNFTLPELPSNQDLVGRARQTKNKTEWSLSFLTDPGKRPNYAINPNVTYLADGSFSLFADIGAMIVSDRATEPKQGHFEVSKKDGSMYSDAPETTLGSLDIRTVDGYERHPASNVLPSTNFSPVKAWLKSIWPFDTKSLIKLSIAELIQAALIKGLDELIANQLEENSARKQVEQPRDVTLIIEDNQEIEDEILNSIL